VNSIQVLQVFMYKKTQTIYGESCTPALLSSVDTNQTVKYYIIITKHP